PRVHAVRRPHPADLRRLPRRGHRRDRHAARAGGRALRRRLRAPHARHRRGDGGAGSRRDRRGHRRGQRLCRAEPDAPDRRRGAADLAALETLGRLLAGAERPVVVAGGGIWWDDAAAALTAFATRAGLPVFMNGAGRGALPTSHANAFAQARSTALARADLVLVLGAPLDFRLGYGRPPTSRSRITGSPPRSRAWSHPRRSWSATAATWSVARRRSSRSTGRGSGSIPARSAVSASVPPSRSPPSSCTPSAP